MAKRNVAVVLAGGKGSRMGNGGGDQTPKQFFMVGGKTILDYSVRTFANHPGIDEVVIV